MSFRKLPEKLYSFGCTCEETGKILAGIGMFLGGILFLMVCSSAFLTFLVLGFISYLAGVILQSASKYFVEDDDGCELTEEDPSADLQPQTE